MRLNPRVSSAERGAGRARGRGSRTPRSRSSAASAVSGPGRPASDSSSGPKKSFSWVDRTRAWCARCSASSCSAADNGPWSRYPSTRASRVRDARSSGSVCVCCSSQSWSRCSTVRRKRYASSNGPASRGSTYPAVTSWASATRVFDDRIVGSCRPWTSWSSWTANSMSRIPPRPRFSSRSSSPCRCVSPSDARLHRPDRAHRVGSEHLRPHVRLDEPRETGAELGVAGQRSGLDQRLELPGLGPPLVPGGVGLEAAGERAGPTFGPEVRRRCERRCRRATARP